MTFEQKIEELKKLGYVAHYHDRDGLSTIAVKYTNPDTGSDCGWFTHLNDEVKEDEGAIVEILNRAVKDIQENIKAEEYKRQGTTEFLILQSLNKDGEWETQPGRYRREQILYLHNMIQSMSVIHEQREYRLVDGYGKVVHVFPLETK